VKEASIIKKSDKERKSKAKYDLGYEIINKSDDGGKSKTYNSKYDEDSGVDVEDGDDAAQSAAYRKENKIPVELPTQSRKRVRASPPKKGHILSSKELEEMYPHMNSCDNSETGDDDVEVLADDDISNANEEAEVK
jgi:hypothetical protein